MAVSNGTLMTRTGRVERARDRGIILNGVWLHLAKEKPLALPMRGALVSVDMEDGRYLARINLLDVQDAHTVVTDRRARL
jgi:hypothetical protein